MAATRIAIIGAGKIARDRHVPAIRADPAFDLVATVDTSGGLPDIANFATLRALTAALPGVEAVAICTPPQIRAEIAENCIDAGLHVLLEKPPAATLAAFDDLVARAATRGVTLFAAWHSRFAPMVGPARAWLDRREVTGGRIVWREDVRRWHPGQGWLWAPGGLGVFDPGINAFSILTTLLAAPPRVTAARLEVPENAHTPIAAALTLRVDRAEIAVDLDFRQEGQQHWDIVLDTACGHRLTLSAGGHALAIDDDAAAGEADREYAGVYAHFAHLIAAGRSDADGAPLRIVADALLVAATDRVAPFHEAPHHQVA